MEKRFWLGVGLLVLFLALGLGVFWAMDAIHTPAERSLEQAAQKALSGQMDEAVALAKDAQERWDGYWKLTASVADHCPMEEVDRLFEEMEIYAQAQEEEHFAACCAQLSQLVSSMSEAHRPSWWNFL